MPIDDDKIFMPSTGGDDTGGSLDGMDGDFAKFKADAEAANPGSTTVGGTPPAAAPNGDTLNGDEAIPPAETKPVEEKPTEVKPAAAKPADAEPEDDFTKFQLPKHARGETGKQFGDLKNLSRRLVGEAKSEVAAVRAEFEAFKTKYAELEKGGAAKPEDLEELKQLREWSRLNDYENSPEFKRNFVEARTKAENDAYETLKEVGYDDATVAKIKEFGGLMDVDLDKLAAPMTTLQREAFYEPIRRLLAIDKGRKVALEQAKNDKAAFETRVKSLPDPVRAERDLTVQGAEKMLEGSNFFKALDLNALPANVSKELATAYNSGGQKAQEWLTSVKEKLSKGEPIMHEVLAVGAAAQRYLLVNGYLNSKAADAEKRAGEFEKRAKDAEEKLTRFKAAGAAPRTPTEAPRRQDGNPFGLSDNMDEDYQKFLDAGAGGAIPRN